jgi:arylsulfatase A-like enzyme
MINRRTFLKSGCSVAAASLLAPGLMAGGDASPTVRRPNVLFIMTDQQFAEAMSCRMSGGFVKTPALDSLAANGMVFTRAYTANPLCMPARNSIFTGRYPHETGVTRNVEVKMDPAEFVCLGTYFRQAGYETAYFGKWHLCFAQKDTKAHGFAMPRSPAGERQDQDARTATGAAWFISQRHDQPFLLVASFLNPHNICEYARGQPLPCGPIGVPPVPEQCPPAPANLAPPEDEPDSMTMMRKGYHASPTFPVGAFTPEKWRQLRWAYYRMIEKVDAEIGRVLQALRQAGLEEKTLIIFTSDHGECAGAHGFNQKTVFYEESVRVPLIVSLRGVTKPGSSDKMVNTGLDILPTMLDFAGTEQPKKLTGRSLKPLVTGEPVTQWRDHVVVENHMDQAAAVDGIRPVVQGRMVRTQRYKYCIYSRGERRESLVDLQADPGEMKDLARDAGSRQTLLQHRALLMTFAKEHNDSLAVSLLENDVPPRPFTAEPPQNPKGKRGKKAAAPALMSFDGQLR